MCIRDRLYIDRDKLSFTRAECSLSMDNKVKAVQAILAKKPYGLRFKPQELSFLVTYKDAVSYTHLNPVSSIPNFPITARISMMSSTIFTILFRNDWICLLYTSQTTDIQNSCILKENAENHTYDGWN